MPTAAGTGTLSHRVAQSVAKRLARIAVAHHNRLQFLGYEVANVVLVVHASRGAGHTLVGPTFESAAALAMLLGSACIWRFDPARRPSMLFVGGMALTLGGLLLAVAGYTLTGLAVALASLETARGGLLTLRAHVAERLAAHEPLATSTRHLQTLASHTLGHYAELVDRLLYRRRRFGRFVNARPFLTGTLIKAPLRLEFIGKKLLAGDPIGVAVGLSWMILGDGGLALNDSRLKASLHRFASSR